MDNEQILGLLRGATVEPYQLGLEFRSPMIPPVSENCTAVEAGPLRFVIEARRLDDDAVATNLGELPADEGDEVFDDYGPTLHVYGTDDGVEHLRFDCFANKPHYHYVRESGAVNIVCRFDQIANGDPVEWTVACLRQRLPEMLDYCGMTALADRVRAEREKVDAVAGEVAQLLRDAHDRVPADQVPA